mgnify:CR=1 FL=1
MMKVINVITPHFPPEVTAASHRLEALVGTLSEEYKVNVFTLTEIGERAKEKAVSYTHLRAHETVLDLVCRLLLDKKKIHKKKN